MVAQGLMDEKHLPPCVEAGQHSWLDTFPSGQSRLCQSPTSFSP